MPRLRPRWGREKSRSFLLSHMSEVLSLFLPVWGQNMGSNRFFARLVTDPRTHLAGATDLASLFFLIPQPLQVGFPGHLLLNGLICGLPICGPLLVFQHLLFNPWFLWCFYGILHQGLLCKLQGVGEEQGCEVTHWTLAKRWAHMLRREAGRQILLLSTPLGRLPIHQGLGEGRLGLGDLSFRIPIFRCPAATSKTPQLMY